MKPHHRIYVATAELIADAHAERLTPARLQGLEPVDAFDADEEDQDWVSRRAVAALGSDVEHFILRTTTTDRDIWTFGTYGDPSVTVYEPSLHQVPLSLGS